MAAGFNRIFASLCRGSLECKDGLSRTDWGVLQVAVSGVFLQTTASEILDGKGVVLRGHDGGVLLQLVQ